MSTIRLTGWIGGKFGLRVSTTDRDLFCGLREGDTITLSLPDGPMDVRAEVPKGFWGKCPEFRANEIGCWMCKRGEWPWETHQPPKYSAEVKKEQTESHGERCTRYYVRVLGAEENK